MNDKKDCSITEDLSYYYLVDYGKWKIEICENVEQLATINLIKSILCGKTKIFYQNKDNVVEGKWLHQELP